MKVNFNYFPNYGYLTSDVPFDMLQDLKNIITESELEKMNKNLAGNIKKEFSIPKAAPIFEPYLLTLCLKYNEEFKYLDKLDVCTNNVPLVLSSMWVNFQEKHEFNPIHDHSGLFSFVIWVKVPFDIQEERANSPGKESNHNTAGAFQFCYTNVLGNICAQTLDVDKNWEGKICLFPSKMNHIVSPFYSSDDQRISVSGNIMLKT